MSLENLLKYIEAITLLLPLIDKVTELIERIFSKFSSIQPAAEVKKASAMRLLSPAAKELGLDSSVLGFLVDDVVAAKNMAGEFKHGG